MKELEIKFRLADSEYLTALRLVAGAVCSAHDVDVDTMEDFKVCVTESVNILKSCGFETVNIIFAGEKVECSVSGEGGTPSAGDCELSLALISALVENCDIGKQGEAIKNITLRI